MLRCCLAAVLLGIAGGLVDADEPPRSGPFTVRLLDERGKPIPGLRVSWRTNERPDSAVVEARRRWTNDDGFASFDGPVVYAKTRVVALPLHPMVLPINGTRPEAKLSGPHTETRLRGVLPITWKFVDAESGEPVDGVRMTRRPAEYAIGHGPVVGGSGQVHDLVWHHYWPNAILGADWQLPPGYLAWRGGHQEAHAVINVVGEYTRRLTQVVPLRHELRLEIEVFDYKGKRVDKPEITEFGAGGVKHRFRIGAGIDWSKRRDLLKGLPFFRGDTVYVEVAYWLPKWEAWDKVLVFSQVGTDPSKTVCVRVDLPTPEREEAPDAEFRRPRGTTWGLGGGGPTLDDRLARGGRARLDVKVVRFNGQPAVGALVAFCGSGLRTDEMGHVSFDRLSAQTGPLEVYQVGLLPIETQTITISRDDIRRVVVREPQGGELTLSVSDAGGQPLPFALVDHRPMRTRARYWCADDGGVQEVGVFTDFKGTLHLPRMPLGEHKIDVEWGRSRKSVRAFIRTDKPAELLVVFGR